MSVERGFCVWVTRTCAHKCADRLRLNSIPVLMNACGPIWHRLCTRVLDTTWTPGVRCRHKHGRQIAFMAAESKYRQGYIPLRSSTAKSGI